MSAGGQIPHDDPDIPTPNPTTDWREKRELAEYNQIVSETALNKSNAGEIRQRIWIRAFVVIMATAVVALMFCAFYHILHQIFGFRYMFMQTGAMIALVLAPVASISSITIALLFGVFRGYKDADAAAASAAVAASVTAAKGS
jgi:hypothetical protein